MSSLRSMLREPTRAQWISFSAAWIGWVLDAFDFTIFLLVMPQIAKDFGVQHVATAGSIALTLLARLVGGFLAGAAADRWGRRLPLLISVIWFALCDGAVALAPSFTAVLVLRTLFGIGMGAEWTSGTTLAMESWPKRSRGIASGVLQGSWAIGYLLAAVISAWVLPRWGWRAMFVIAALPALLAIPMRLFVPESPEHAKADGGEARGFPLSRAFREDPTLLRKVVWGSLVMAVGFGAYYGLTGLYPTMLRVELGYDDGGVARLVALFNIGMLLGSIAVGVLAAKRGPTLALAIPAALATLTIPVYTGLASSSPLALAAGAVLGGGIGCGVCGATPMVLTDLFPAEVRARLVGLVYHVGACFAAFVPMATAAFAKKAQVSFGVSITVIAGACELGVVLLVAGPALVRRLRPARVGGTAASAAAASLFVAAIVIGGAGCLTSNVDPTKVAAEGGVVSPTVAGDDPSKNEANVDAIPYRALDGHPGCTTAGLDVRVAGAYVPAQIPGYKCAAKAYPLAADDPKKPIVLLVHGNSSTPSDWEKFPADKPDAKPMLAERLSEAGYRVLAVDVRYDKSDDPKTDNKTENAAQNFDHGWAVPIVEHFIDSVMTAFPDRKLALVAFSVGPTVARDALRRLHRANKKPFERFDKLVFAAGSHHGVSSFRALCGTNPTMRGKVACELGDRTAYQPTKFLAPLNGPGGAWETPCADGDSAFGQKGVCGGHKVSYTTLVMRDVSQGTYQDEFVSEGSSRLEGATNKTLELTDNDESNFFYNGLFKNHMGSIRSESALKTLMDTLTK
ncbi:MAG: MFS transporter [Deltaproteobacteria bacterium]|nr:MFS transporter [Deltaproteobacteria bacterium]